MNRHSNNKRLEIKTGTRAINQLENSFTWHTGGTNVPWKQHSWLLIGYCAFPQNAAAPQPRVLRTVSYSMSLWWVFSNAFHHLNHGFLHLLIKSMSPSFSLPLSVCLLFFRSHSFPSLSLSLSRSQSLSPALWPVLLPCRSWLMMRKISQGQAPC